MNYILSLLKMILEKASPEIREALVKLIKDWEEQALATPNKIDDILVGLVKMLLLIE